MRKAFSILFLCSVSIAFSQSTNYATRVTCEVQSAYPELRDLVWLQGTTPAVQAVPMNAGKPLAYDASTSVRMIIGPNATGTNFAVRTNAASVTNGYAIQWPTIGTNSSTNAWFYTLLFDRAGQTYWSGSGRLYIDETTSTASNGIDWIEYTIPNVAWENIVGDPSTSTSLVAYVESHSGGSAVDDVARTNAAEALAVGLAASNVAATAYGWGNHVLAGYALSSSLNGLASTQYVSENYISNTGAVINGSLGIYNGGGGVKLAFDNDMGYIQLQRQGFIGRISATGADGGKILVHHRADFTNSLFANAISLGGEFRTNWPTGTGATYTVQGGTNVTVQTNGSAYVVSSSGAGGSIDTNAVKAIRDESFRAYVALDASSGTGTITTASTLWLSFPASDDPRTLAMGTGFNADQTWRFYVKVGRGTNTFSIDTNLVGYSFLSLPVSSTNHILIDRYPGDSSFRVLQVYR